MDWNRTPPCRRRTCLRSKLPWSLIDLGVAAIWAGCTLAACVCGCAGRRPATGPDGAMAWKTGVSTRNAPWDERQKWSLSGLRAAGVEYLEIGLSGLMQGTADEQLRTCERIVAETRAAGLVIWSVHIPYGKGWDVSVVEPRLRQEAIDKIHRSMELCRVLRPQIAVIHASAEPIDASERAGRLRASHGALAGLTSEFARMGVRLAVEDLPRTCLGNTSDEVLWLIRGIEGLGVCLDSNHLLQENLAGFVRKVGPHIVTMHASDYDGVDERHWMPGDGINDWRAIARSLKAARYRGPFLYETAKHKDGSPVQPAEYDRFRRALLAGIR